jgi:HAD superfamily hydrolase (TIGR01459 family)
MSFAEIAERYDGFIIDLWGVVHNGVRPYPGVLNCLANLRALGKPVVFLSNAPRRAASVAKALATMGIGPDLYTAIMSSGEAVHLALRDRTDEFAQLGETFIHLGPERDRDIFETLPLTQVENPAEAGFLLNTGPDDLLGAQDPAPYSPILEACLRARLAMVCANPDLEVIRDGVRILCAGALAETYRAAGGQVIQRGKPDPAIYIPTLALLGTPRTRTLALGDSLRTDIAGAVAAGIDSCWVLTGINTDPSEARLRPTMTIPAFIW